MDDVVLEVDGHEVTITHPDKVFFEERGETKLDLVEYYRAVAVAREMERRRPDLLTAAWWKEERGERIFVDFNQNAPHKTVFGAWGVRARPGAQASTPFAWDELATIDPDSLTIATVPARLAERGDPWADMYDAPQSLAPLLELHERDRANGLHDAPWPPVYPKQPDEPPRVAPSRARKTED
jgi:DNA primase